MSRGTAPGPVTVLRGHQSDVQALAFHPLLNVIYSGDASGELRIWDTASRRSPNAHKLHSNAAGIIGLACLSEAHNTLLLSQDREGTVRTWVVADDGTLASSEPLREFCTQSYTFCRISALEADRTPSAEPTEPKDTTGLIATPGEDPSVAEIWGIQSAKRLAVFRLPPGVTYGMCMSMHAFRHGGRAYLAVGYEAGHVAVWRLSECSQPLMAAQLHKEAVMALVIDSSATGGVSGAAETALVCFRNSLDTRTMAVRKSIELHKKGISDVALRPDDKVFATAGWDGKVRVYNYKKAAPLAILKYHTAGVTTVAFSADHLLASAARDGTIALWSVYQDDK